MKSRRYILLVILILGPALSGCGGDSHDTSKSNEVAIPVHTVLVTDDEITPVFEYAGTVEPNEEAALGSEIPGRIERFHCDVGDTIPAGFLIAELGSETLIQARANFEATEKDWNRIQSLREAGSASQQAYDRAQAAYDASKATYDKTLASTLLKAPFSGVVTHKYLEEGEVFTLMPGAAGSPAIIRLMKIDTVKVVISAPEKDYSKLSRGQTALLHLDAYPGKEFAGEVSLVAPTLDTRTRTADVEVKFANHDGIIRPGMFGKVVVRLESNRVLLINLDALIRQEGTGTFFVYRVIGGQAERVDIERGQVYNNFTEIKSGLQAGDTVVTSGKMKIKSGSKVVVSSQEVIK
ncbi:putative Cation efflux system protein [Candidatus Zixiibacteriota bacterium]|nr:putative Cation efflux system protein [candidate division Zixibacteria bacterium]